MTTEPTARGSTARVLASIGVAGPIFYIVLVTVLGLLWEGYNPIRDTQSELGAVDSPYRVPTNAAGFMGLGVSILAFAGAYHLVLRKGWAKALATGLIVIAGVGMVVVGFFPCDAGCVDVTRTGRLHGTFSMPGAIGLPIAVMISSLVFRSDGRWGAAWQVTSFWLGLVALGSGPIVQAGLIEGANGLLQRAGMWPPIIWMAAASVQLYALTRRPALTSSAGA